MLEVKNLSKSYGGKKVLKNIFFKVNRGEVFALLGSNGAGKTTTIKAILNLIKKDSGSIYIRAGIKIGYSPETPYFHPFLTGRETLQYYGRLQKNPKEDLANEIKTILKKVDLQDNDKTKVGNYSKGMVQKLALAQALLGDPDLLILDEPTAGLDAISRVNIIDTINDFKSQGKTIILNSHILNDVERVVDRGLIIKNGQVQRRFTKEDLKNEDLESIFVESIRGEKNASHNKQ